MGQILQVNDLHVYYGSIHAVKGVSFEVNEGEVVTLIGANGAGKSTVLNTVSGLLHPKHGSVVFEGKDLKGVPAHKIVEHGLAQVPEGRHVFLQMTVEDNLEMGAYTQPNSTIEAGIADVYERFPRDRRYALWRRAADARHGQSAHVEAEAPDARRAVHGPRSDPR